MINSKARTWAEIDLNALENNFYAIKNIIPKGCKYLGVVKADAYGHGAVQVAKRLEKIGADYLAVAVIDEAIELRKAGIELPIIILGYTSVEYIDLLIDNDITQTLTCEEMAVEYSNACIEKNKSVKVHLSIDTGMSRIGILCNKENFELGIQSVFRICKLDNLEIEGIFTHFAVSDVSGEENQLYTENQYEQFIKVIDKCHREGFDFKIKHCANTGATINYTNYSLDMVRPGLSLYGYGDEKNELGLMPVMSLYTKINTIKEYGPGIHISYGRRFKTEKNTRIGVVGIGYADGLHRRMSNNCSFYSEAGFCQQRGSICMDMCMIDITDKKDIVKNSVIEIFGKHSDLNILAEKAETITYELLCSVSKRIPRVYKG